MASNQRIQVTIAADTRQFSRAMKNLGDTTGLSKLQNGLKAVGKAALIGATALSGAAVAGAVKVTQLASDLQQSQGAVNSVFGKGSKEVQKYSKNAAKSLGLSQNAYNTTASLMGSMLKNAGVPMDKLAGKTNDFIKMGADLSATFGGTTQEAADAMSAAFRGEYDQMEKYGIKLSESMVKQTMETKNLTRAQAIEQLVMKQGKGAMGAFARESNTLAGQQQRLKAKLENLGASVGTKLLPVVTKVVTWLSDNLEPAFNNISDWVQTKGVPLFQELADKFSKNVQPVLETLWGILANKVFPALKNVGRWVKNNSDFLLALGVAVGTALAAWKAYVFFTQTVPAIIKAVKAAQVALNAAMRANPIGLVITAIAALVAGLVWFFTKTKTGKKIITVVWGAIKKAIKGVSDWWTKTAWPAIKKVITALGDRFVWAKKVVTGAWGKIKDGLKKVWNWIKDKIFAPFRKVLTGLKDKFDSTKDKIKAIWDSLKDKLRAGWTWIKDRVLNKFKDGMTNLKDKFSSVRDKIKAIWDSLKDKLKAGWTWIKDKVFAKFKDGLSNLKTAFRNVKDGIKAIWGKIKEVTAKPINFVLDTVYNGGIRMWWNKIADKVGLGDTLSLPKASMVKFANGSEDHRAQIAPAGSMRLWAEPETGGEAYIPLAQSKRGRSTAILQKVADKFGYNLSQYSDGGFWDKVGGVVSGIGGGIKGFGKKLWDYGKIAMEVIKDPVGAIKRAASQIFSEKGDGGFSGDFMRIVSTLPVKFAGGLADKVKSLFDSGKGKAGSGGPMGSGGSSGMGVAAMTQMLRGIDPSAYVTSGFRGGAITSSGFPSFHGLGRAIDIVSPNMGLTFDLLKAAVGSRAQELYYSGRAFLRDGQSVAMRNDHWDHVHWAMANGGMLSGKKLLFDSGGYLPRGTSIVQNNTGKPEPLRRVDRERGGNTYNITVNVPVGANKVETGRAIVQAISAYEKANGGRRK